MFASSINSSTPNSFPFSLHANHAGASKGSLNQAEQDPKVKEEIVELKKRDAEVRRHEQTHATAAGKYSRGGPKYEYTTGPDGKRYVVDGEVSIDTSEVPNDPEATIRKAQQIKRAALAPEEPSAQDRSVAAEAARMEVEARKELAQEHQETQGTYTRSGKISEGGSYSSPQISEVA